MMSTQRLAVAAVSVLFAAIGVLTWHSRRERLDEAATLASVSVSHLPDTAVGDTAQSLRFRICNNGYQPITAVAFTARAFTSGDATGHPVAVGDPATPPGAPHVFTADTLLAQANCAEMSWEGSYATRDSVHATITTVRR